MYVLINVYAPNKDKDIVVFLNKLLITAQNEDLDCESNIIIGGDFNCPLNPAIDKKGGILIERKSVTSCIDCLKSELDLVDIWRIKNPDTKSFTWSKKSPRIFCRLDYWLISNNLTDSVQLTDIIPAIRTDHDAIFLEIGGNLDHVGRGPSYWKLNCSLLDDEEYINSTTEMIPVWIAEGREELSDDRCVWDWVKYNIRAHAIRHSSRKAKQRKETETKLQNELNVTKQAFESNPSDSNATLFDVAQKELEYFYEEKTKGIIVRARARWHEYGEKSTKYFLNLEKRNHVKKHIRKLYVNDEIKTNPLCILNEVEQFYCDLYKSKNNRPDIENEIDSFLNNKSPGNDGIPIEFYKKFWPLINDCFTRCANECFEKGELSHSQKHAIITLIEKKGKDRSLIDFQKAFDSIEWDFLFKCIEAFNFGSDFLRWVKLFYNNVQSCIMNNGITSKSFQLERGVRQGDPLSPYLFIVAVETLAIAIRQNPAIKGITIGKEETKLLQYADDTTAVLADTKSATVLFQLLDLFKNISGLKINSTKTEGLWIGSSKENKAKPLGIKWPNEPIKTLGVYFTYDPKLLKEKNFIERLDSIKKLINVWSSRGLSVDGKVTIIKSFLIPKFVYVCSVLPTPNELAKQLNQLLFKFLWNGTDKVTRVSVINEYEEGGLKMINLDCMIKSLRLAWLKRIFEGQNGTWKTYLQHLLESMGGFFLLKL